MSIKKFVENQNETVFSKFDKDSLLKKNFESPKNQTDLKGTKPVASNYFTDKKRKLPITRIVIKYDVGFTNSIYIRGFGGDLSWDKGILLNNINTTEWVYETTNPPQEFKVLINDRQFELGSNHTIETGASREYTPNFYDF